MIDVEVIEDPAAAAVALAPIRGEILSALREPGSATSLAATLGLPRQKINYHLHALEAHGLIRFVEERARRGLIERIVVATARAYVVSPSALSHTAVETDRTDRLSTRYLIAVGARMVREVADLARRAEADQKPLATLTIDSEIRFASASDRAAFTAELSRSVNELSAKYHDESGPGGRWHRLIVASHPFSRTGPRAATDVPTPASPRHPEGSDHD